MKNIEFGKKLENRTKMFSINIIRLSSSLPNSTELKVVKNQIVKSATSIGANYREANRSRSKADFTNKIRICQSEASETVYWLEILIEVCENRFVLAGLLKEGNEILAIFTSIISKLRQ